MPEFKKKTALGLRDLPENGQECTHVLLTHSEYDGLLAKVACAERDARSVYTAASQKIAQAERNSAQAKEAAYAEVDAVQKDLEEACRKIEYLNGLNKNLLRIARERANADRKLRPKKTHTGYVVLTSSEKEYRYKTMRKENAVAGLWETALQSPYSGDFTDEQKRRRKNWYSRTKTVKRLSGALALIPIIMAAMRTCCTTSGAAVDKRKT